MGIKSNATCSRFYPLCLLHSSWRGCCGVGGCERQRKLRLAIKGRTFLSLRANGDTMTRAEYTEQGIIISGPTAEDVRQEINTMIHRNGDGFMSFTTPVKDAKGIFVAFGHVRLSEPEWCGT